MKELIRFIRKLKNKDVLVVSHESPDGDAIGSILGLGHLLTEIGARPLVVNKDGVPGRYAFLLQGLQVHTLRELSQEERHRPTVAFVLDSANLSRIGFDLKETFPFVGDVVNIDHHISNGHFGSLNAVDPHIGATSEIIGGLYLDILGGISPEAATAIYTGVMTDTGNLTYQSTTSGTVALVSILHEQGADVDAMRRNVYESDRFEALMGIRYILEHMKKALDGYVVYTKLPVEIMDQLGLTAGDLENFIEYPRKVDTCEVAILFKELEKDIIRVSIRTKKEIDANALAGAFGGGGHVRAAGFRVSKPMDQAMDYVLAKLEEGILSNEWRH